MGERDDLVLARKDHVMVANDGAGADRGDADLLLRALLPPRGAVKNVLVVPACRLIDRIREGKRRAARGIELLVVVLLHDLAVKARREELGCRLLQDLLDQVDADGHVCTL